MNIALKLNEYCKIRDPNNLYNATYNFMKTGHVFWNLPGLQHISLKS